MDHTSRTQKLFSLGYVAEGMASCKYHVFPPKSVLGSRSPSGTSWSHPGSSSRNASVGHPCILFSHAMANKDVHKQVRVCAIAATPAALVLRSATACFGFSDGTNPTRGGGRFGSFREKRRGCLCGNRRSMGGNPRPRGTWCVLDGSFRTNKSPSRPMHKTHGIARSSEDTHNRPHRSLLHPFVRSPPDTVAPAEARGAAAEEAACPST